MKQSIRNRLDQLEQAEPARRGVRVFGQDTSDPSVYFENGGGLPWSRAEIDALSAQGYQCIVVEYVENWRSTL